MKESGILIFAGTTEGRELSELLSLSGIDHTVSVATAYGEELLKESTHAKVLSGRMDEKQIGECIKEKQTALVIDATHPYASEAGKNIKHASEKTGVSYLRFLRESGAVPESASVFPDNESCAEYLMEKTEGNILLTTGSKELKIYAKDESLRKRLYARVIPNEESLSVCREEGISSDHIIAMQGPFDTELNRALIKQFDIKVLVTKESGKTGGFEEKCMAALKEDIQLAVISRKEEQVENDNTAVYEAVEKLTGKKLIRDNSCSIFLIGAGPGSRGMLTKEAEELIQSCDILYGAESIIKNHYGRFEKRGFYLDRDIIPDIKKTLNERYGRNVIKICVLFSGDSGFYSGCRKLYESLSKAVSENVLKCTRVEIVPGISSVSYFSAKLGINHEDALMLSVHGRKFDETMPALINGLKNGGKVFLLVSGKEDVRRVAEVLSSEGLDDIKITAGCRLSHTDEVIKTLKPADTSDFDEAGSILLFLCHP